MDIKLTIDDQDVLDGIAFARERDNARRDDASKIKSDEDWVLIEIKAWLSGVARQKVLEGAQKASYDMIAAFDKKMAEKTDNGTAASGI